jgi:hypothetical protein
VSCNVGPTDRRLRLAGGALAGLAALVALAHAAAPAAASPILGAASVALLVSGATRTCGLYALLGLDTT